MASNDVILLLTSNVEICSAALISIRDHSKTPAVTSLTDHTVLHRDFLSLLALVYSSATKLSLTLKPPSPTYKASLDPLKDIPDQISAISHCVCLFAPDHGMTLMREVASVAEDVIQSVRALLQIFLENETRGMEHAGSEYLVRTGAVHDLIAKARAPGGVSENNLTSVRKKWKQDHDAMDDGLNEIGEMIKVAQASGGNDDLEDNGWDELGLQSSQKMDQTELERAKKVHTILRLSNLLHKQILKGVLSPAADSPLRFSTHAPLDLDTLLSHSSTLLISADDLLSTMYTPQNPSDVVTELASYMEVIQHLRQYLHVLLHGDILVQQLDKLNLNNNSAPSKDSWQWYNSCFDQIQKAADALKPYGLEIMSLDSAPTNACQE